MSNIFYSQVDPNLQSELNARGLAGFTRSNKDLQYMLEKVANVQLTAYSGSTYSDNAIVTLEHGILGGETVRSGRYLPTGPDGYLSETKYTNPSFITLTNGKAELSPGAAQLDRSYRTGPYITTVDVQIGDHSMGLLNKATVAISIPNPQRDLDTIEEVWFRPGRNVKIEIANTPGAVITDGLLSSSIIPNEKKLQELYEPSNVSVLSTELRRMNEFRFYGLITSFEFSYQANGTIDATISLTGTSNVYTDVSMWIKTPTAEETAAAEAAPKKIDIREAANTEFYTKLMAWVSGSLETTDRRSLLSGAQINNSAIVPLTNYKASTDRFLLYGGSYPQTVDDDNIAVNLERISENAATQAAFMTASLALPPNHPPLTNPVLKPVIDVDLIKSYDTTTGTSNYNEYITLGSLIEFINTEIVSKITGNVSAAKIDCDDIQCSSNYYEQLTSCIPNEILLLPIDPTQPGGINSYGDLLYYKNLDYISEAWPGITSRLVSTKTAATGNETAPTVFKPSRIFINVDTIQRILLGSDGAGGLTVGGTRAFTLNAFMSTISSKISYATGKAIHMQLMTDPMDQSKLLYTDVNFLKTIEGNTYTTVTPYSVPMFANHPYGTIVREFSMRAKLPENAKNLSYVLNSGADISEEDIAPYMNFMYNAKDPAIVNAMIANYKKKHDTNLAYLAGTRAALGLAPMIPEQSQAMYKVLTTYIKYPTDDIAKSAQITAPIFPFDAEFTIDGISGLRYGDVLKFDALPTKYTVNTVFSIIGITHTVASSGAWTTLVRCIMRTSLG